MGHGCEDPELSLVVADVEQPAAKTSKDIVLR